MALKAKPRPKYTVRLRMRDESLGQSAKLAAYFADLARDGHPARYAVSTTAKGRQALRTAKEAFRKHQVKQ